MSLVMKAEWKNVSRKIIASWQHLILSFSWTWKIAHTQKFDFEFF